ncbi:MAG TPA: TrkA C-terminal domain-containing protein [Acidimicrobiales bacterium]|nr:TrkA C-terminal domain-containing protein [Acidimicrobiales bacterium]
MPDVTEIPLPGIGVRHEFRTASGVPIGVLTHRGGRRELVVYDAGDLDTARVAVRLTADDSRTLAELLGASSVSERAAATASIEGLSIDWLTVAAERVGPEGKAIAELEIRSRTGVSIIAILRDETPIPAPEPSVVLLPGDTAVVTGTAQGMDAARRLLTKE